MDNSPRDTDLRQVATRQYKPRNWRIAVAMFAVALAPYSCGFLHMGSDPPFTAPPSALLPMLGLGAGLLLFLADWIAAHRILSPQIWQPTLQTALYWHGGLFALVLVFWPVLGLFTNSYCVPFCGFPILFSVVFAYVGPGSACALYGSAVQLVRTRGTALRWLMGAALVVGVGSWAFAIWFGLFSTWEAWQLDRHWDDYNAVIELDATTFKPDDDRTLEYRPLILPERYTHLAPDGFYRAYDDYCAFGGCNVAYFATYYGGPTRSHGLVWCLDDDEGCWLGGVAAYMTADYTCIQLRPNWYRCIVW